MDYGILERMSNIKSSNPYVFWMHLWETYGDPNIPPLPKDLLPTVVADSSLDEITPLALVAPTDPIPAIDASNLVQQDPLCLPTLPSCDDFLPALAGMFMESHIEDVGDILDDIHLLFEVNSSFFIAVIDSCTSAQ